MPLQDPVLIVDYGMGNLGSIRNMIRKLGGSSELCGRPEGITNARKLILPGVGAFDEGMSRLRERNLLEALGAKALGERAPVLGICLGMQLLSRRSEEGSLPGLGWIEADTRKFRFPHAPDAPRVPHMGWNDVRPSRPHPLLDPRDGPWRFYFVHSYHVCCDRPEDVLGTTDYGGPFVAGVARDNILGVQFHPEKSHSHGMRLLRRFLEI